MSSHYVTEPPPTASVLLNTTAGPIQVSLFANQAPLACRNFLQHILDGYYDSTTFHRVMPGFIIQGGDPTGIGEGGESIFEDREFEIDPNTGEKVVFGDELHSRLKFNRRGLLGMAKMGETTYGSQFFLTLADVRAQLDGQCTMFGRVEGDGIYSVVRISEAENVEGTERPAYPFKITSAEVLQMPKGESWASMKKRERVAKRTAPEDDEEIKTRKKTKTKKLGKALLSFGAEEGDEETGPTIKPNKKFNTSLINDASKSQSVSKNGYIEARSEGEQSQRSRTESHAELPKARERTAPRNPRRRESSNTPPPHPSIKTSRTLLDLSEKKRRKPLSHDSLTQLPLENPESPSRSPTISIASSPEPPAPKSSTSGLHAEIAALKASMRRAISTAPEEAKTKSALEQLIPETSIRGRKRPRPGDNSRKDGETAALTMLKGFKARLEKADHAAVSTLPEDRAQSEAKTKANSVKNGAHKDDGDNIKISDTRTQIEREDQEPHICDLHFIADCQSCSRWDHHHEKRHKHHGLYSTSSSSPSNNTNEKPKHNKGKTKKQSTTTTTTTTTTTSLDPEPGPDSDSASKSGSESDSNWMSHVLSFEKDRLGKDLTWKRKNEDELVVIDPREKAKEIIKVKGKKG